MSILLRTVVMGAPVGKARARVTTVGGFARAYTPKTTKGYEALVTAAAMRDFRGLRLNGLPIPSEAQLRVVVVAVAERPKNLQRRKDPDGLIWRHTKPDADNVAKAVLDALEKAGLFRGDQQVVDLRALSAWSEKLGAPRTIILVETAERSVLDILNEAGVEP